MLSFIRDLVEMRKLFKAQRAAKVSAPKLENNRTVDMGNLPQEARPRSGTGISHDFIYKILSESGFKKFTPQTLLGMLNKYDIVRTEEQADAMLTNVRLRTGKLHVIGMEGGRKVYALTTPYTPVEVLANSDKKYGERVTKDTMLSIIKVGSGDWTASRLQLALAEKGITKSQAQCYQILAWWGAPCNPKHFLAKTSAYGTWRYGSKVFSSLKEFAGANT